MCTVNSEEVACDVRTCDGLYFTMMQISAISVCVCVCVCVCVRVRARVRVHYCCAKLDKYWYSYTLEDFFVRESSFL